MGTGGGSARFEQVQLGGVTASVLNKINKLHERSLRIGYKDDISSFEELLLKHGSLSTHHRNIHALAIEMYKSVNDIAPAIIKEIFMKKGNNGFDLRSKNTFLLPKANTVHYGHDY